MLKFEEVNSVVKDNEVSINGHVIGKVTDEEAKYIISLIQGTTSPKPVATAPAQKTYKDVRTNYKIEKKQGLYIIRADGWSRCYAHRIANAYIKALPEIITAQEPNSNKPGTHPIWGYKTKKAAENALATLPEIITAKEQELLAEKSKRD